MAALDPESNTTLVNGQPQFYRLKDTTVARQCLHILPLKHYFLLFRSVHGREALCRLQDQRQQLAFGHYDRAYYCRMNLKVHI